MRAVVLLCDKVFDGICDTHRSETIDTSACHIGLGGIVWWHTS